MYKFSLSLAIAFLFSFITFAQIPDGGYQVNDIARDFSLKNVDLKMVSMKDYKDAKGIILIFTCNHCPFSIAYENRIINLHNKYAANGFPVLAINSNDAIQYPSDSYENMQVRAQEKKFPFAYLHDETQQYAKFYGARKTPHVFLLQKVKEDYQVMYIGAIDDNSDDPEAVKTKYVELAVDALLEGKKIERTHTKAIGCSIKWKK